MSSAAALLQEARLHISSVSGFLLETTAQAEEWEALFFLTRKAGSLMGRSSPVKRYGSPRAPCPFLELLPTLRSTRDELRVAFTNNTGLPSNSPARSIEESGSGTGYFLTQKCCIRDGTHRTAGHKPSLVYDSPAYVMIRRLSMSTASSMESSVKMRHPVISPPRSVKRGGQAFVLPKARSCFASFHPTNLFHQQDTTHTRAAFPGKTGVPACHDLFLLYHTVPPNCLLPFCRESRASQARLFLDGGRDRVKADCPPEPRSLLQMSSRSFPFATSRIPLQEPLFGWTPVRQPGQMAITSS